MALIFQPKLHLLKLSVFIQHLLQSGTSPGAFQQPAVWPLPLIQPFLMHAAEIREDKLINGTFALQGWCKLMLFTLFVCPYEVWLKKKRKQPFKILQLPRTNVPVDQTFPSSRCRLATCTLPTYRLTPVFMLPARASSCARALRLHTSVRVWCESPEAKREVGEITPFSAHLSLWKIAS